MVTIRGTDTQGVKWTGVVRSDDDDDDESTIDWESDHGHSGTETVKRNSNGTMTGTKATDGVVPCEYDGEVWTSRDPGDCPSGEYEVTGGEEWTDGCPSDDDDDTDDD